MNAVTFHIPSEIQDKIEEIAATRGVDVQTLLSEVTARMVDEFDAHQQFLEMAKQGESEIDEARQLLNR